MDLVLPSPNMLRPSGLRFLRLDVSCDENPSSADIQHSSVSHERSWLESYMVNFNCLNRLELMPSLVPRSASWLFACFQGCWLDID
jgi:hypothetical protein